MSASTRFEARGLGGFLSFFTCLLSYLLVVLLPHSFLQFLRLFVYAFIKRYAHPAGPGWDASDLSSEATEWSSEASELSSEVLGLHLRQ